jgi:hypothetical protein
MSSASVEVACGGGQWPHQRISGLHEGGFFDIVEAELAGGDEHQTSHSISLLGCQHTVACVAEQVEGVGMQDFSAPVLIQAETVIDSTAWLPHRSLPTEPPPPRSTRPDPKQTPAPAPTPTTASAPTASMRPAP